MFNSYSRRVSITHYCYIDKSLSKNSKRFSDLWDVGIYTLNYNKKEHAGDQVVIVGNIKHLTISVIVQLQK